MSILGNRIARLLEERDWTHGQLATYAGVDRSYISLIIAGRRTNVGSDHLRKIARALNTTVDYLLGLTDDPRPLPAAQDQPVSPEDLELAYTISRLSHPLKEEVARLVRVLGEQEETRKETKP